MSIIKTLSLKKAIAQLALFFVVFAACQPDNEILNSNDVQNVNAESTSSALLGENADIATKLISSLTNTQYSGARISAQGLALNDSRLKGAVVTLYTTGTSTAPAGTIIISFETLLTGTITCTTGSNTITGSGTLFLSNVIAGSVLLNSTGDVIGTVASVTDNTLLTLTNNAAVSVTAGAFGTPGSIDDKGILRKGQIRITYAGKRWTPGSYYITKLTNFYRNSAHIEGTDTTNFISTGINNDTLQLKFESLDSGKVTFGDGRRIERKGKLTKTWTRFVDITSGKIDPLKGELLVTGSGTGTNKFSKSIMWDITSPLLYSLPCWIDNKVYIPVKGEKTFTVNYTTYSNTYTINYGDGTCDNLMTVKFNGGEKTIMANDIGN